MLYEPMLATDGLIMKISEFKKILASKMKEMYPKSYDQVVLFEMKHDTRGKIDYYVHIMAMYRSIDKDIDSEVIKAKTVHECIAEMDRRFLGIKKFSHIELE
jgi:hypothetical protein